MTWPADQVKTEMDQATDDPKIARSEFAGNVDKFNLLRNHVTSFMQAFLNRASAALGRTDLELKSAALKDTGTSGDAVPLLNASADFSDAFLLSAGITPSQITANTNNYDPTGLGGTLHVRANTDASRNITGLAGGAVGRLMLFTNVGSFDIVLMDQDTASTAGNRFLFAGGGDRTLTPNESVLLRYDGTTQRWRLAGDSGAGAVGGLVGVTFFTADGTWTPKSNGTTAVIFCTGGGGGGGGAGAAAVAGGGAGGSTAIDFVADTQSVGTPTVTIGTGSTGRTGTDDAPAGGTSSVGSLASAGGGAGGNGSGGTGGTKPSIGGTATVGDLLIRGGGGSGGDTNTGGMGGSSFWGGGSGGTEGGGAAGDAFCYGAGGGASENTGDGGDGEDGVVMILEW